MYLKEFCYRRRVRKVLVDLKVSVILNRRYSIFLFVSFVFRK